MGRITLLDEACQKVHGFSQMYETFLRKLSIAGKSESSLQNYGRHIAKLAIFSGKSPLEIDQGELEEYLYYLKNHDNTPSSSSFKHLVYGLRHLYKMFGKDDMEVCLPEIKKSTNLPVVFSKEEVKKLLAAPKILKQRVLFATIYDAGLRISELRNLRITDADLDRLVIHVRESKYKKDRYVPISSMLKRGLQQYLDGCYPSVYLFNGKKKGEPMSKEGIRHAMRAALKNSGIKKKACVHTLRHTYATHLLEDGLDIVTVKNQMGHVKIETTMMYLHIAQISPKKGFGPLSTLYPDNR